MEPIYKTYGEGVRRQMLLHCCLLVGEDPIGMAHTIRFAKKVTAYAEV